MKQYKIVKIGLLFLTSFFILFFLNSYRVFAPPSPVGIDKVTQSLNKIKVTLAIDNQSYEFEIQGGDSVYDLMKISRSQNQISFKEKNYPGLGEFIEEINGVKGKDGKYWIYYVNNKEMQVGISNTKLKDGDVVSWRYQKDNE